MGIVHNVIIVDDEPVIRFGLKASVNWDQEGLCLLGDFPNGEEALRVMEQHKIDILITDIKMPVMDGLTLMKKALERFPALKVILVSSYTDFEYVREGLQLGAVDYVLKPTLEPEEFSELLRKCVKLLEEEQTVEEKLQLVHQAAFRKEQKSLEQTVKRAILQDAEPTQLGERFAWLQGPLLIVTMRLNYVEEVEERFGFLFKTMILEDIQERFYETTDKDICFPIGETELLFVLQTNEEPYKMIETLKTEIEQETNLSFTFGYARVHDVSLLKEGFEKSRAACNQRFFHEDQYIFQYEPFHKEKIHPLQLQQLHQLLLSYDKQKLEAFLQRRCVEWRLGGLEPSEIKKEAYEIVRHLFMKKLKVEVMLEKFERLKKAETLRELTNTLFRQLAEYDYLLQHSQTLPQGENQAMTKALDYIHEHYTEELTLQMVANHIHISRNYFSVLFKRIVGQNFIDYVIDLRIKKAKELLQHTSLKVYEVAEQSGFGDDKYFSKLFKKLTGSSPADFRTKNQKLL